MLPNIGFIESYSLMMLLGIIGALVLFELYFRKHLKESKKVYYFELSLIVAIMAGLIGAYLTQNLYNFIEDPEHYVWEWSLTFYGGAFFGVGGFFAMYFLWARKHYKDGLKHILVIAPASFTLAHAIGRVGCFMAGCCYGIETDAWYGIQFTTTTCKVMPTNLWEAIFLFILSGILTYLAFKKDCKYNFSIYLISYGIWRFLIEYVRGDHRGNLVPGLSPSQFWSILLVVGGVIWLIILLIQRKKLGRQ